jgi:hypothetical protein
MMDRRMNIREHMPVRCSDGYHLGTVDRVMGDRIRLAKSPADAYAVHHWLPLAAVAFCDEGEVRLSCTAQQARESWQGGDMVGENVGLPDDARWHSPVREHGQMHEAASGDRMQDQRTDSPGRQPMPQG